MMVEKKNRVAIFGGSFDPPHMGHVLAPMWILSRDLADKVLIIPCINHPFGKQLVDYGHRYQMCKLAFSPYDYNKKVKIDRSPIRNDEPSYMIDTVRYLIENRFPENTEFSIVIGDDCVDGFENWKHVDELKKLTSELIVLPRGTGKIIPDFSSTEIRRSIFVKKVMMECEDNISLKEEIFRISRNLHEQIPADVLDYILKNHLYEEEETNV